MTRVLLLGYDPASVDFSDPALPPGMTVERVQAGIQVAMAQFASRGWEADLCSIRPDETAGPALERQLASASYDCVVIGAGVAAASSSAALRGRDQRDPQASPSCGDRLQHAARRQRRCGRSMVAAGGSRLT